MGPIPSSNGSIDIALSNEPIFGFWKKTTRYRCNECRVASLSKWETLLRKCASTLDHDITPLNSICSKVCEHIGLRGVVVCTKKLCSSAECCMCYLPFSVVSPPLQYENEMPNLTRTLRPPPSLSCEAFKPAVNGTLFRAEEGEGGEEEEWRPTPVTPLPLRVGSLTATSPTVTNGGGTTFPFIFTGQYSEFE